MTNGIPPLLPVTDSLLYVSNRRCWNSVGSSSGLPSRSPVSTEENTMWSLAYVASLNVTVGVFARVSGGGPEVVDSSPVNVPKRLSATTIGQRSTAQNGQY